MPPFGHTTHLQVFLDPGLLQYDEVRVAAGTWHDADVFVRADLLPGHALTGPALVIEPHQTIVVEPGWSAEVTALDHILLRQTGDRSRLSGAPTEGEAQGIQRHSGPDPVLLEVFANRFMAIAEEMGVVLRNTAHSVNIKERLDFSCAIFNAAGELVANAPHMPVHLGSMGESIKTVIHKNAGAMQPGDVIRIPDGPNDPDIRAAAEVRALAEAQAGGTSPVELARDPRAAGAIPSTKGSL